MRTLIFAVLVVSTMAWLVWRFRMRPSMAFRTVDSIVPAYNEELCITDTIESLIENPYINRLIVVNDGSTDGTAGILDRLASVHPRMVVVHKENGGKGSALMAGVERVESPYVFLTDADTFLPPDKDGLGYLIAEMERGADAVGGLPSSNLKGAGIIPHIRAAFKDPMIVMMRTFQQMAGGAPFIISGACGMFRTDVLRKVPFSDRTKVEDLDLSWSLVQQGYDIRLASRCIVYSQECNSLKAEWLRWRRWIVGYAVCMRLHRGLLLSRFGLITILPMFLVVAAGISLLAAHIAPPLLAGNFGSILYMLLPVLWLTAAFFVSTISAIHHRTLWLIPLAPAGILYLLFVYAVWLIYGIPALFSGREPARDKPTRYVHVVG